MEIKEERFQEELQKASISLVIDTYDDIFSDFDPRPFNERALSDDFLLECKRAARDKDEGLELLISIPKHMRSIADELKIKRRLKDHFKHHHIIESRNIKKIKAEGFGWIGLGTIFILTVSWLHTKIIENFAIQVAETMLEPAGWFSFWEGLGKIFIVAKEQSAEYEFYKKMSQATITFRAH